MLILRPIRVVKQRETTKRNETPIVVQTQTVDESCSRNEIHNICQLHASTIEKQICYIHFGQERQGLIVSNVEIDSHYHDIHSALLATFFSNIEYAILVLEGYMMALIKQMSVTISVTHMPETQRVCLVKMALQLL